MSTTPKVAFITGGNRGIGLETAKGLGKAGVQVVIGVRDLKKGEAALATLKAEGVEAEAIRYDANDSTSFDEAYAFFDKKYGKLDILVNNAGVSVEKSLGQNTAATVTQKMLHDTFQANFFAVIELTQKLLPLIKKAPAGRIVNLSSVLASLTLHSDPKSFIAGVKTVAYDASKTALNAFTVHLAHDLRGTKIKVNSAHPGWVKTDMGGPDAPMALADGGKTSVELALLGEDGPTAGYFHMGKPLPW
jgi:NAD(P)-dependent dehydrogenase (short-subunit alcohol dehydrogenase family)